VCHQDHDELDATTYYFGDLPNAVASTGTYDRNVVIPIAGKIVKVVINYKIGTVGTNEASTFSLRLNNATDYALGTLTFNAANPTLTANVNINVAAGDLFQIKVLTPTWVTNPLLIRPLGFVVVQCV
jgi:hypothetical protein